ncbi:acyl-CoA dehydrogenase [Streptomyces sp. PT12]|uniref:acyl-CoA dehydrogenase n=1 Tax=Streptomyces sp. PT12 TaxID=1510197 RepID=UPI000DE36AF8|nr:acyl-CoA dehydrogenase [Streptomyces sp. PT12]RBM20682.1 acyl-CoA dehydrogenase [Streptomyces sp. PT12]
MASSELIRLAQALEEYLGDPHAPTSLMPYTEILDSDEREEYPYPFINLLQRWGVHEYALPERQGGRAGDVEIGFALLRLVARRDPTTATGLIITNLSFLPAWIAGSDALRQRMVDAARRGHRYAWGLSERAHGSDLLNNETRAREEPGGYRLTGEKWLIGNARVADSLVVLARTSERGGPAGYSVFVVDKRQVPAGSVDELPRERLHGLRALDMSGFLLRDVAVPEEALVGAAGQGVELALKSSQVARVLINSIALSCTDTALRLALDFADRRRVFGTTVGDIPYSRRQLTECFADLMVADAVCLGAVRSLQVVPEQSSVWSSVAKYLVPTLLERTVSQLNVVLGARFYLRDHPHYGVYQKMLRDLPVANFADGNTVVNLKALSAQLLALLGNEDKGDRAAAEANSAVLFDPSAPLPPFKPWRQELFSRGRDDALLALPGAVKRLRALAADAEGDEREWLTRCLAVADDLPGRADDLLRRTRETRELLGRDFGQSAELFDLAKEYCLVHAMAGCLHVFVRLPRAADSAPLPSAALLLLQLERIAHQWRPHERLTDAGVIDEVMRVLRELHGRDRLFSHWPIALAKRADLSAAAR